MDLLAGYGDSSDEESTTTTINNTNNNDLNNSNNGTNTTTNNQVTFSKEFKSFKTSSNIAPNVNSIRVIENKVDPNSRVLNYNPTIDSLYGSSEGPHKPYTQSNQRIDSAVKNHKNGVVEQYYIPGMAFNEQYYNYKSFGYSIDPTTGGVIGNQDAFNKGLSTYSSSKYGNNRVKQQEEEVEEQDKGENNENNNNNGKKKKNKREYEDPADIKGYQGSWAPKHHEIELKSKLNELDEMTSMTGEDSNQELTVEQKAYMDMRKKQKAKDKDATNVTSVFYGKQAKDYMGRSWVEPASDIRPDVVPDTFVPKKLIHTWTGHNKGVSAIRFFPRFGHLLLSASMDSSVRIWDMHNDRQCLQSYHGHQQAVRDICFTNDGRQFLSCGYDRQTRLWDTETGKIISSYSNGKIPYCIKFNPDEDKQNQFLVGGNDKKILQYDIKSGEVVQEYDQHLGAINTITFLDDNRRFVSSSDDKSLRVWDWGIPVVIKYISEPDMHSMPSVALHPKGKMFAAQSMDNQILIYNARDKFRMNKKKRFMGHMNAGYACQLNFSPDGKYVISGDGTGKAYFWDWSTCRVVKSFKAHDDVCIGIEWHPLETSRVATCSWDGKIKYWD